MHIGVPQGTVQSLIVYIMYVTVLSNLNLNENINTHANDAIIIVFGSIWDIVRKKCEVDMLVTDEWFSNKLKINNDKSKFIIFSNVTRTTCTHVLIYHVHAMQIVEFRWAFLVGA